METIIYEAFQVFKEEGIGYGSLGVAPLAGLNAESKNPMERLLQFIYDHLNACYGFRDLYRAKEKYSPTEWVPSYYASPSSRGASGSELRARFLYNKSKLWAYPPYPDDR